MSSGTAAGHREDAAGDEGVSFMKNNTFINDAFPDPFMHIAPEERTEVCPT
jgi:hypothetical protein